MSIGCASQHLAGLDVHVEQDGIVIGGHILPSSRERAAQCCDVIRLAFFGDINGAAGICDHLDGTQGNIGRQMLIHPLSVIDMFLTDSISPVRGIFVKVDSRASLLVTMIDDNGRSVDHFTSLLVFDCCLLMFHSLHYPVPMPPSCHRHGDLVLCEVEGKCCIPTFLVCDC